MRDNGSYRQCEFPSVSPEYVHKPYRSPTPGLPDRHLAPVLATLRLPAIIH